MRFGGSFIFPCLVIIKLSESSQNKTQSSSSFFRSGRFQEGTILSYFSFPLMLNIQVVPGLHDNNTAGASLDVWSWAHVQLFLGGNTERLSGSPKGQLLCMRRTEACNCHPGGLGQRREKKESALLTFQLPLDQGPLSPVLSCRRAKILLCLIHYA